MVIFDIKSLMYFFLINYVAADSSLSHDHVLRYHHVSSRRMFLCLIPFDIIVKLAVGGLNLDQQIIWPRTHCISTEDKQIFCRKQLKHLKFGS